MSIASQLAIDLKRIAAPELPRDREMGMGSIAALPHFDDRRYPALGPLVRAAKCLCLALRRGVPAVTETRLHALCGGLAEALGTMPAEPERTPRPPPPEYTPYWRDREDE